MRKRPLFLIICLGYSMLFWKNSFANAELDLAQSYIDEEQYERGIALAEGIKANSENNPQVYYIIAQGYYGLCEYEDAYDNAVLAVKYAEENAHYNYWHGKTSGTMAEIASIFSQASYAEETKLAMETALALDPSHVKARYSLINYLYKAPGFMGGDVNEAKTQAQSLQLYHPLRADISLALIEEEEGNETNAEKMFQEMKIRYADDSERELLSYYYGHFLMRRDRYDDAMLEFQHRESLLQDKSEAWLDMAQVYVAKEDPDAAIKLLKEIIKSHPHHCEASDLLSDIE